MMLNKFSCKYLRKCIENSMENIHNDVKQIFPVSALGNVEKTVWQIAVYIMISNKFFCKYLRKFIENSMENIHNDVTV